MLGNYILQNRDSRPSWAQSSLGTSDSFFSWPELQGHLIRWLPVTLVSRAFLLSIEPQDSPCSFLLVYLPIHHLSTIRPSMIYLYVCLSIHSSIHPSIIYLIYAFLHWHTILTIIYLSIHLSPYVLIHHAHFIVLPYQCWGSFSRPSLHMLGKCNVL